MFMDHYMFYWNKRSRALLGDQRLAVHTTGHVNQADYHSKSGSMMFVA